MTWGRLLATIIRSSRAAPCRAGDAIEQNSVRLHGPLVNVVLSLATPLQVLHILGEERLRSNAHVQSSDQQAPTHA